MQLVQKMRGSNHKLLEVSQARVFGPRFYIGLDLTRTFIGQCRGKCDVGLKVILLHHSFFMFKVGS
jgi:hypothetical protein